MKAFFFHISLLAALMMVSHLTLAAPQPQTGPAVDPPRWEKIGQRKVNRGLDRDEIPVTVREGRFSAIKLIIRRSGINLHRVVVHFGNGDIQEVDVRHNIPANGETRVIDIDGGRRVIQKVVFWYDTKGLLNDKAVLELWGRH